MIDVLIVATLNQSERLLRLLESIDHPVGDLVVIDNGLRWPRGFRLHLPVVRHAEHQTLVELPGNLGVAGAWNLGIKVTPHASRWLIVNDDAWFPAGALARFDAECGPDVLSLSAASPQWACFMLGDEVVNRVGLFDERFHPAYCEDDDFERRCQTAGMPVVRTSIKVGHDNSSTVASGVGRNFATFGPNADLYQRKKADDDGSWSWDLRRRRELSWERD